MSAITKERIELFIKNPLDNGLTRGEQMELARIALTSLEAEPVAWLHSDNGLGIPAITRSKNVADSWLSKGWYVQPLYIAKPVPVVPDARPSLNNGIVGFDEGWNACRATMLHGAKPVSQTYKLNKLSGNSPVTPDSWISCSDQMPEKGQNVLISVNFDSSLVEPLICSARYTGSTFRRGDATIKPGNGIEQATHWMPLPEPPQEVNRG
ncbi:DUF551 domain-containing protein [Escherichia coli]|nr:DUF551 domain-containing protein [Escherichia coli]EJJ0496302.1 DUF551 domain-containing protein [Escherichia coli]EJL4061805.1 DUF551 domain-containing protein [Escherichia coli]EJM1753723.1 DUF551 domain-containing protein [Escherichia coli]EJM2080781.1 DUF551 domain-containing protein [Escherichia coli]